MHKYYEYLIVDGCLILIFSLVELLNTNPKSGIRIRNEYPPVKSGFRENHKSGTYPRLNHPLNGNVQL